MDAVNKLGQQQRRNKVLLKTMKVVIYIILLILSRLDVFNATNSNENYFKILLLFALPFVLDIFIALFEIDTHVVKQIILGIFLVLGGTYIIISFSGMIIYPHTKDIALYQYFKSFEQNYVYWLALFPFSVIFT